MVPSLTFDIPGWVVNSDQKVSRLGYKLLSYSVFLLQFFELHLCNTGWLIWDRLKKTMVKIEAAEAEISWF